MVNFVTKIEAGSPTYAKTFKHCLDPTSYPAIWAIGNLAILENNLLGFFCSAKCPGNIILKSYDLARALRDAGIAVISGFHSPIEKDSLDLFLRGNQPVVICPARSIAHMRIPSEWKKALDEARLLLLSPFSEKHKRITAQLAKARNLFVGSIGTVFFVPYAEPSGQTEKLCVKLIKAEKRVYTFRSKTNAKMVRLGVKPINLKAPLPNPSAMLTDVRE